MSTLPNPFIMAVINDPAMLAEYGKRLPQRHDKRDAACWQALHEHAGAAAALRADLRFIWWCGFHGLAHAGYQREMKLTDPTPIKLQFARLARTRAEQEEMREKLLGLALQSGELGMKETKAKLAELAAPAPIRVAKTG